MRMAGYGASGSNHDFVAYDSSGNVWDGSAFVAWVDVDFASYRIAPTVTATIGGEDRFEADAPTGTVRYELRFRGATAALSYLAWESSVWASQASVDAIPRYGDTQRWTNTSTSETHDITVEEVP